MIGQSMSEINLFTPLKIRGVEFTNRLWVSPMCMYSANDGVVSDWHRVHLGAFATGGAGLVVVEATGVSPKGRISVGCVGIWNDEQAKAFKPIIEFSKSMGSKIGIQLAHAGRKGSTTRPGSDHPIATDAEGGWIAEAPSAIAYGNMPIPHALTVSEIQKLVQDFADATKRSVDVGFDVVEIHSAHGYLLHQFLSPLSNLRTDEYGGSFENRTRFLLQTVKAVRAAMPDSMPLFVRISATDWTEGGWDLEQSIELATLLKNAGVDLIDVSSAGLSDKQEVLAGPGFQVPFATAIREATGIFTSGVGLITSAEQSDAVIREGKADAVFAGRAFLRNPRWALEVAHQLKAIVKWPHQIERGRPLV